MILKDKEIVVFSKPKTAEDVLDHFKNIEKRSIHTLNATFACEMVIYNQLKLIFEEALLKAQDTLKRLKIRFDATPLSHDDLLALNKFIARMKSLRHLELSFSFCNLNLPAINSLVEGVITLQELKGLKLDLSGNPVLSDSHQILGELWRVPSKYLKLKLCQCNISLLELSLNSLTSKTSGNFLKEYTSSSKQEYQKQGNQQSIQNQQQQQGQIALRKSRRGSQNVNVKEEVSSDNDRKDVSNCSVFGAIDQKSDNQNFSNIYPVQGDQGKQQFQNTQMDASLSGRKGAATRSKQQVQIAESKGKQLLQSKKPSSRYRSNNNPIGVEGDDSSAHLKNKINDNAEQKDVFGDFEEEEDGDQISKNNKQLDSEYNEASQDYDKGFFEEKVTPTTQNNTGKNNHLYNQLSGKEELEDDHDMTMEIEDEEYNGDELDAELEEEEVSQVYYDDDEYKEEFNIRRSKIIRKNKKGSSIGSNSNVKTRSNKKESQIQKKPISKQKVEATPLQMRKESLQVQQTQANTLQTTSTKPHSKTAGKGEAYFNRTYKNNSSISNGGISKMNIIGSGNETHQNFQEQGEQNKAEALNTLVNSLQYQRQNSSQYNQEAMNSTQNQASQVFSQVKLSADSAAFLQSGEFRNERVINQQIQSQSVIGSSNNMNQQQYYSQHQVALLHQNQQQLKKQQKRVIEQIVLDLRQNPNLQQSSLKSIANSLTHFYSQVNEFHLKTPSNSFWNHLSLFEFGACLPSVLDIKIDPIGFSKIAFTNMIKGISTAFRKLKFGEKLKDIPNTLQVQEELQNWFCSEKDFVCKKGLEKEDYLESKEMEKNIEMIESENFRYQQVFFHSYLHSICPVCQNEANELHYLQANTHGLNFCYSQENIDIKDFSAFLDKVSINLQNQFSQIFNEGEIRENLCSLDQQILFANFLNKSYLNLKENEDYINEMSSPIKIDHEIIQISNDTHLLKSPESANFTQKTPAYQDHSSFNLNSNTYSSFKQNQQQYSFNSPQLSPFQLPKQGNTIQQISPFNIPHTKQQYPSQQLSQNYQSHYNNPLKFNSFQRKLERALRLKWIESVNMQFTFQDYFYEEQYDLVQKIYNMIKIISQRVCIYKLYLSVYQGISPLILSQILLVEELEIDKIEAGSCFKDGNIFYINLQNPKFVIQKDDLQIFAEMVNANASFEEIHINFDKKQTRCMQSISHLLTRYRQSIDQKENTLTIYRGDILPVYKFTQSVDEYLEMMDESGNFVDQEDDDMEQEMSTQLIQTINKSTLSPLQHDRTEISQTVEQEERTDNLDVNLETIVKGSLQIVNYSENPIQSCNDNGLDFKNNCPIEKIDMETDNINEQPSTNQEDIPNQINKQAKEEENEKPTKEKVKKPKGESKRKSKKQEEQNQENGINIEAETKNSSKKRNNKKSESNKGSAQKQNSSRKSKKQQKEKISSDNKLSNENLDNYEKEQEQKSSSMNQQIDNEEKVYANNINNTASNNNTNSNNTKGEQFCSNINRFNPYEKTNQNPQQLLY